MTTDTPVSYKYSKSTTRYGIITRVEGGRAKVQWQAEHNVGSLGQSTKRIKLTTTVAIASLTKWTVRLRLIDGITLNPDGLEYRTPKQFT
jgi:hypothetical protein